MDSLTRPINLMEIAYPVFKIGSERPMFEEGVVLFLHFGKTEESAPIYYIVDDTTLPGKTLAERRIQLLRQGVKMKKLSRAVFFLGDLIKVATASTWFIDSNGTVFKYKKKLRVVLSYHKINKILPILTGGAILEIEGIPTRFKCLFKPHSNVQYAGIIKYGMSFILYDLSMTKYDNTRRMI